MLQDEVLFGMIILGSTKLVQNVLKNNQGKALTLVCLKIENHGIAGSLEAAYSLNWGAREIWGKGGGETLALL